MENDLAFAIRDSHPVSPLHSLIIPKRHIADYFELTEEEVVSCAQLLAAAKQDIKHIDETVTGFNVGINVGKDAGQSVMHCHIHLISRRRGDVENPQGGVRHLMPGKGHYKRSQRSQRRP